MAFYWICRLLPELILPPLCNSIPPIQLSHLPQWIVIGFQKIIIIFYPLIAWSSSCYDRSDLWQHWPHFRISLSPKPLRFPKEKTHSCLWHFLLIPDTSWDFMTIPDTSCQFLTLPGSLRNLKSFPESWMKVSEQELNSTSFEINDDENVCVSMMIVVEKLC